MSLIVIGGQSRSVGKTSVVAGLIAAMPERRWTAIKITQHWHGICSENGQPCDCAVDDRGHSFAITEDHDRSGASDTSRYLLAGAQRSIWVRTRQGYLAEVIPHIRRELDRALESGHDVILESNSIMRFLRPDLYIPVIDPANPDFKQSAREYLDLADAVIMDQPATGGLPPAPHWEGVSLSPVAGRPAFDARPPQYVSAELVAFVRRRLRALPGCIRA